jgi:ferric iron reductase protein FhuF
MASDGRIATLKLGQNELLAQTGADRFHGLVDGHLAPFIDRVARRGGVTPRVLWSNTGHIFEAFLTMIGGNAVGRPGLADARSLLARPTLPWGGTNPLYQPVRYVDGRRLRRVCCLRLLIPEWRICAICPAKPRPRHGTT